MTSHAAATQPRTPHKPLGPEDIVIGTVTRNARGQVTSVTCLCQHRIFDGDVVRSRCVHLALRIALCKCRRWVQVPLAYASPQNPPQAARLPGLTAAND